MEKAIEIAPWFIPGMYALPGVGQVVIAVGVGIMVGTVVVKVGTEMHKKIEEGLRIHFAKQAEEAKKNIPDRLKNKQGNVDLDKFDQKVKKKNSKKEKGGWEIDKDRTEHGGSKWKLKDPDGKRIASLDENGKILRK